VTLCTLREVHYVVQFVQCDTLYTLRHLDSTSCIYVDSVLQRVAACCRVLQRAAECCSVLQCVAVRCSVLQCVAVRCSVSRYIMVCCSVLQYVVVCCNALFCFAVLRLVCLFMNNSFVTRIEFGFVQRDQFCSVLQRVAVCCSVLW